MMPVKEISTFHPSHHHLTPTLSGSSSASLPFGLTGWRHVITTELFVIKLVDTFKGAVGTETFAHHRNAVWVCMYIILNSLLLHITYCNNLKPPEIYHCCCRCFLFWFRGVHACPDTRVMFHYCWLAEEWATPESKLAQILSLSAT